MKLYMYLESSQFLFGKKPNFSFYILYEKKVFATVS